MPSRKGSEKWGTPRDVAREIFKLSHASFLLDWLAGWDYKGGLVSTT